MISEFIARFKKNFNKTTGTEKDRSDSCHQNHICGLNVTKLLIDINYGENTWIHITKGIQPLITFKKVDKNCSNCQK